MRLVWPVASKDGEWRGKEFYHGIRVGSVQEWGSRRLGQSAHEAVREPVQHPTLNATEEPRETQIQLHTWCLTSEAIG